MVRDFDLIRKILIEVQAKPAGIGAISISYDGEYAQGIVNEHVELLIEAGLLKGKVLRGVAGLSAVAIDGLTWDGHNFIDAAENESIWRKAIALIKGKGGAITFEVLKEALKSIALDVAGLS